MKKAQLEKMWKKLDGALDALEMLAENGFDTDGIDESAISSLMNEVAEKIEEKTKTTNIFR